MATARVKKLRVTLDDRTVKLSEAMLICRSEGHDWRSLPPNPARFNELLKAGYKEVAKRCVRGCGSAVTRVYDRRTGGQVESPHREYDPDYKMPKATGRMSPDDARVALWARQEPELYV